MNERLLERFFAAIRSAASPEAWSSGVSLAREGKIVRESEGDDEIVLRVVTGGRGKSHEVTLYPPPPDKRAAAGAGTGIIDWQCDCGTNEDACAHAAAAVIALRQADKGGVEVPTFRPELARLGYRLSTNDDLLNFERVVKGVGPERPYPTSLAAERGGETIITQPVDLDIERAMGTWRRGVVPRTEVVRLLDVMARLGSSDDVTLDGAPVRVMTEAIVPELVVEDAGRSFFARLTTDRRVERRLRNGAAVLRGSPGAGLNSLAKSAERLPATRWILRPLDDQAGIGEGDRRLLERGRGFDPDQVSELVHLVARFEGRLGLDIRTKRLPKASMEPPRLVIETFNEEDALVVLPTMVYGDPPIARIDRGRLVVVDDARAVPLRDERAEEELVRRLVAQLGLEPGRKVAFEGEKAVAFAAKLHGFSTNIATIRGEAHLDFEMAPPLAPHLALDDEGRLSLSFESDGNPADPARVLRAWQRGRALAPVDGGGFAALPARWLQIYGPALSALMAQKREGAPDGEPLPLAAVADVAALCEALGRPLPPRFEQLRTLVSDFTRLPPAVLPADLRAELRHYQQEGVDWLAFHREAGLGALLADDMGLGKTLQALAAMRGKTLVVAPTSVLPNWAREAARFRPGLTVHAYHGADRKLDAAADVTLTTWAILRLDQEALAATTWDTLVLDEAQTIKNPDSQVARAAYRLSAKFRMALTGTPVENRLDDLWSTMHVLQPGYLGDRATFQSEVAKPIMEGDARTAAELRRRLRPFILRRLKRDVAPELPPRTELVARCELSPEERTLYDAMKVSAQREVQELLSRGGGVIAALEALLRVRQAACHRGLVPGQEGVASSAKIDLLLERLEPLVAEGHKVLVFSQWTSFLDLVEPHLQSAGWGFLRLDGSTRDRGAVVDAFQADAGPPILLLSLKAGGVGLNLTAADHVVLLDPWWNPAVEDQAADRAHRIGQDKPVFVHRLVAADTVEERILLLQESKRQLAEAALGQGGGGGGASLTKEDLAGLLG